jgi:hypothetical protein
MRYQWLTRSNSLTRKQGISQTLAGPLKHLIRLVFSTDQVNSWLQMEDVIEGPGSELKAFAAGRLAAITGLMAGCSYGISLRS